MCYIQNAKALRANGLNLMTTADINPSLSEQKVADGVSETDLDEPTKAEILADVKTGLQQAFDGDGRPAREAFAEIRSKIVQYADPG